MGIEKIVGLAILGIVAFFLFTARESIKTIRARGCSLKPLLFHFKQKFLMTFGLGVFFGGCYITLLLVSPYLLNKDNIFSFLSLGLEHPSYFLYLGLSIFVLNALF